ncbi:MAG: hypothetical protein M3O28_02525 [Actinomycetota bacterium]|nr:hypothetical protein [Actinomycetota bacterium]
MVTASDRLSTTSVIWIAVGVLVVLSVLAGFLGRYLVRRGLRTPWVIRYINRASERVVDIVKRPITIAVLDEVAAVLQAGQYTHNIAVALAENHDEIKQLFAEKIKADPTARRIGLLPFHDKLIDEASETTLRVLLEVLADPRTQELVSELLRDNIAQIRAAVRLRDSELRATR